jgi:N utilization substance protein A
LSPASVLKVEINEERKQAKVTVTEEQAPLAIGKGGMNVNLAARLTGYEIDIAQTESEKPKEEAVVEAEVETPEMNSVEPEVEAVGSEAEKVEEKPVEEAAK